MKKYLYVLTGC